MLIVTAPQPSLNRNEGTVIQSPEEIAEVLRLDSEGWGSKKIANELGMSRNTVKRYIRLGGWQPYAAPRRANKLQEHAEWIASRFHAHQGNADVIRQELRSELGVKVSLRTVERAVAHLRKGLVVESIATVRFETAPGQQIQIDFGCKTLMVGEVAMKVFVFVAVLGYSRRIYAQAFCHERQSAWFQGLENAFRHFGGITKEVLVDNAAALVKSHNRSTGELAFNERFHALCRYYDLVPRACAPYRARTKGKDERAVGYVKNNALAGRDFDSLDHVNSHLQTWTREVADVRIHGTTGDVPAERFERKEFPALRPVEGKAPFVQVRELTRQVANDSFVDVDTNRYSVPWSLIKESVTVTVSDLVVYVHHAGKQVAQHAQHTGRNALIRDPAHFAGILQKSRPPVLSGPLKEPPEPELLRALEEYEELVGARW